MAYQNHPHINPAAADGGDMWEYRHHQINIQLITNSQMINFPAATPVGAQPPPQHALSQYSQVFSQSTTVFHNYTADFAAAQPPQGLLHHPTFSREATFFHNHHPNSAATHGGAQPPPWLHEAARARLRRAYDDGGVVVALPVPLAADLMATPPQRDEDGLPEEVVTRFLETRTCEKAGDGGDSELCAVCQDDLCRENGTVVALRCSHRFHGDCIGKWLQMKNVCPLCKDVAINIL